MLAETLRVIERALRPEPRGPDGRCPPAADLPREAPLGPPLLNQVLPGNDVPVLRNDGYPSPAGDIGILRSW